MRPNTRCLNESEGKFFLSKNFQNCNILSGGTPCPVVEQINKQNFSEIRSAYKAK